MLHGISLAYPCIPNHVNHINPNLMESFTTDGLVSLLTLTFLETVLGIVNIVFIDRNRKKIVYP